MYEATYEHYLGALVKDRKGEYIKLMGVAGLPDRMILLPGGKIIFVELKRDGKRPRENQKWWLRRLHELGFCSGWCDCYESIERLIDKVDKEGYGGRIEIQTDNVPTESD